MNCDAQPPSTLDVQSLQEQTVSRRLNRKTDIALLPFLSLLYLFNGLDRSNIGNAQTQGTQHQRYRVDTLIFITQSGFTRDIGATPDDLNLAVSLFFVTFVLLQPPSAAIGRLIGAKNWITLMMVSLPTVHTIITPDVRMRC
jgi:MFS family permease